MSWLTEDPTNAVMLGILATGVLGCFAYMLKKRLLGVLAVIAAIATFGILITERMIITDREQIHTTMYDLAAYVGNNRVKDVLNNIDPDSKAHDRAGSEMPKYEFRSCNISGINNIDVKQTDPPTAEVTFVVFVNVNAMQTHQYDGVGRREVTLKLKKSADGTWKIIDYSHRYPSGGAELGSGNLE